MVVTAGALFLPRPELPSLSCGTDVVVVVSAFGATGSLDAAGATTSGFGLLGASLG